MNSQTSVPMRLSKHKRPSLFENMQLNSVIKLLKSTRWVVASDFTNVNIFLIKSTFH